MVVACAVILAAGYGTRMLPATKAQPKEMLPLVDLPIIEYIVEEAVESGIEHIVIVTSAGKRSIEDHFGRAHELEHLLEAKGDLERLRRVRRAREFADIAYVRQHEMGGVGHAVLIARRAVGDRPFVLMLPDDVIVAEPPATRQLLEVFEQYQGSVVCVERVPRAQISSYGVIRASAIRPGVYAVEGLVEKPSAEQAPSDLGIVGRYVFTPAIFEALARTPRGIGGELQITDAMERLREHEPLYARELVGHRYDTGQPLGYLKANIELMLRRPEFESQLRAYLRDLVEGELLRAESTRRKD